MLHDIFHKVILIVGVLVLSTIIVLIDKQISKGK